MRICQNIVIVSIFWKTYWLVLLIQSMILIDSASHWLIYLSTCNRFKANSSIVLFMCILLKPHMSKQLIGLLAWCIKHQLVLLILRVKIHCWLTISLLLHIIHIIILLIDLMIIVHYQLRRRIIIWTIFRIFGDEVVSWNGHISELLVLELRMIRQMIGYSICIDLIESWFSRVIEMCVLIEAICLSVMRNLVLVCLWVVRVVWGKILTNTSEATFDHSNF